LKRWKEQRGPVFGSGMAAITSVAPTLLSQSNHVVAVRYLHDGSRRLFDRMLHNLGVNFTYVQSSTADAFRDAINPVTEIVWVGMPIDQLLQIVDIGMALGVAHNDHASERHLPSPV
jgi:cystathionine gamma-lyase/homocysteine desulfhydrase